MIKVKVKEKQIQITGHAMYDDYGKDIVCAAVSSIVTTSVNLALRFNDKSLNYKHNNETLTIDILSNDAITKTVILNMLELLRELSKKYKQNIIVNEEV